MEFLLRIALFLTGIVNVLPAIGAFLPSKMKDAYGIDVPDANFELLLRHRAVLFVSVGGIMLYAAVTKNHMNLAIIIGFINMLSFIILYYLIGGQINELLTKVMKIDVVASVVLLVCYLMNQYFKGNQ
jgi:hypothetical protein